MFHRPVLTFYKNGFSLSNRFLPSGDQFCQFGNEIRRKATALKGFVGIYPSSDDERDNYVKRKSLIYDFIERTPGTSAYV